MTKAIFLDRDGVLNKADRSATASRIRRDASTSGRSYRDAAERSRDCCGKGFRLIVVTNQPDVARGTLTRETVDAMNRYLRGQSAARRNRSLRP